MTRWEQVERICHAALELEERQRTAFLEEACAGDEELRREVESLLKFDSRGERFIEKPAMEVAAKMVAQQPQSLIGQQIGSYEILSLSAFTIQVGECVRGRMSSLASAFLFSAFASS